ncbi:hypothetical protein B6K86_03555 [Lachnospiraceae bacterium]|nr:hypothetical protein B6K86_03555 [Lachnospiraceae bacterium]
MQEEQNQLLHKIQTLFFRFAMWFEIAMSLVIFAGVIAQLRFLPQYLTGTEALGFGGFLQYLLEMLIGLEIIMMLCRHDLDSIVEVMIFAVTRTLLIMHERSLGMLIGIVAIAVLFAIRKYLFLSGEEAAARRRYSDHIQKDQ